MTKLRVIRYPANNENYGTRKGAEVDLIVIHTMEGSLWGTAKMFRAEMVNSASAHYGIGKDGTIVRFVEEGFCAWHAGNSGYNRRSIGIELEGSCKDPSFYTGPMEDALIWLVKDITKRYPIKLDREHVIGHNEVPDGRGGMGGAHHHTDPGEFFPWARFMAGLAGLRIA